MKKVDYEQILFSLRLLNIEPGDILLMHSALTSIGYVEGGADAVIDAFLEAIGPEGTLVMSTLTMWDAPYDAENTPSAVGIISEVFRKRLGVLRSLHPVHSVAAFGARAEYIVKDHELCETGCGVGTPYMKIAELGGKVILLGVDMDRNTMMHTLEEMIDARFLLTLEIPAPLYAPYNGKGSFVLKKFPPGHRDFLHITSLLREKGAMIEGKIGNAVTKVIDAKKLLSLGVSALQDNPLYFICENEHCNFCRFARGTYAEDQPRIHRENHCKDPHCEICVPPQ
ncbi:MAG: AAC(3) family N-acetyltransferase [Christensenellales bacterium]|jgi:aminoglycoside 3-N-acetyltransferase